MAKNDSKTEKELSIGKIILIVSIVFVIIPILILGVVYVTNDNFKMTMNKYLVKMPGRLGDHFKSYPTKEELNSQVKLVSNYLIDADNDRAVDKLILIKNEDEELYKSIVKSMLSSNPTETRSIVEAIRKSSIKKDMLVTTIEQIENENQNKILNQSKFYENLSIITAIDKINNSLDNGFTSYKEFGSIFENMKKEISAELLSYLSEDKKNKILSNFESIAKREEIKDILTSMDDNKTKLENIAEIYSTENPEKLLEVIGSTNNYSMDELASIYRNLGTIKSAKVLSKIKDDNFIYELIEKIKEKEILINGKDLVTSDILRAIKVYRDFEDNVKEMASIYEKMSDQQIAVLIKRLIRNSGQAKRYNLDGGQSIVITDEDLALKILSKFNEKKVASILSYLDSNFSSEIAKKLTMPNI